MSEDFLSVDNPIAGQNYVCLSFVSPDKIIKNKELFYVKEFLKDLNENLKLDYDNIVHKYEDFVYRKDN